MHRRAAFCLFAILAAAGCRRAPAGPDANYQKASALYQQLYASQLDDAYGDPQMDQVVVLLKMVDSSSGDGEVAKAMLGAIQHGREELAKQRAAREKLGAAAAASAALPVPNLDPEKIIAANAPDAGAPQDPYGPGAKVSEINATTGGCLTDHEPFHEQVTNVSGTIYRLVEGSGCSAKLPGYVGQAVLVVDGRVYRRMLDPNPPGSRPPPRPPGPPDAGPAAAARPPAPAPAAQADAGEEYHYVIPGTPQPGATPPSPPQ